MIDEHLKDSRNKVALTRKIVVIGLLIFLFLLTPQAHALIRITSTVINLLGNSLINGTWVNSSYINASTGIFTSNLTADNWINTTSFNVSGTAYIDTGKITNLDLGWNNLSSYPSTCSNQFIITLADSPTCASVTNAYLTSGTFTAITGIGTLTIGLNLGANNIANAGIVNATNLNASTWVNATGGSINATQDVNATRVFQGPNKVVTSGDCGVGDVVRGIGPDGSFICTPQTFYDVDEEFTGATVVTSQFAVSGTATLSTNDTGTIGVYNLATGTTSGADAGLSVGATTTTTSGFYNVSNINELIIGLKFVLLNQSSQDFIGIFNTSTSLDLNTTENGVFFNHTVSNVQKWSNVTFWWAWSCRTKWSCTSNNTTIRVSDPGDGNTSGFTNFTIRPYGDDGRGYTEFYINNSLVSNLTSNYPRNLTSYIGHIVESWGTVSDNVKYDYIRVRFGGKR